MKFNFWIIMNSIFYYSTLIGSVFVIIETDWKNMLPVEVLYICGTLGGLMYLGDYFRSEMNDEKEMEQE